jgi:hypothetical protein
MEHRQWTSIQCNQKHEFMANSFGDDSISGTDWGSHSTNLKPISTECSWRITGLTIPKPLPWQLAWHTMILVSGETKEVSRVHRRTPKDYLHFVSPQWSDITPSVRLNCFARQRSESPHLSCCRRLRRRLDLLLAEHLQHGSMAQADEISLETRHNHN